MWYDNDPFYNNNNNYNHDKYYNDNILWEIWQQCIMRCKYAAIITLLSYKTTFNKNSNSGCSDNNSDNDNDIFDASDNNINKNFDRTSKWLTQSLSISIEFRLSNYNRCCLMKKSLMPELARPLQDPTKWI